MNRKVNKQTLSKDILPERFASGTNEGPRAMSRVLRLFAALAEKRTGMSLTELGEALNVPKSTFSSSLHALVASGFLICEGNLYHLGPRSFRLASAILSSWPEVDVVRHYVRKLALATNESVGFAIADWEIGQVIFTEGVNSGQPVRYAMHPGIRAPLYASAAGRVLLAYEPKERLENYLSRAHLRKLTPSTRVAPEDISKHLDEVRRLGYCASFAEMLKDTAAIAVPVFDPFDNVIGAFMVAAPLDRMRSNYEQILSEAVLAAQQASGLEL